MAARLDLPLTVYGKGKQVRDLLHVDDLVALYLRAAERPEVVSGRAYNVGGGPPNALSLLELLDRLGAWRGAPLEPAHAEPRPGDQLVFVADSTRARDELGWAPTIGLDEGLPTLLAFAEEHAGRAGAMLRPA
jgi:CDP-paratose 2-epimerase